MGVKLFFVLRSPMGSLAGPSPKLNSRALQVHRHIPKRFSVWLFFGGGRLEGGYH